MTIKNRVKKQEEKRPDPEPVNIYYEAVWGDEAAEDDKFISAWRGYLPCLKQE